MGKQRIAQLLNQLEVNQRQDLKNAAAIYAVAQVAVHQLTEPQPDGSGDPLSFLPISPSLDKPQLIQRYGSYNDCRKAAKNLGLQFRQTPSWTQLVQAFNHAEALQQLTRNYLLTYPYTDLRGVTLKLQLDIS